MVSRSQNVDLDAWFGDSNKGNGKGDRMAVGHGLGSGDWNWQNRFAIRIPRGTLFDGITSADGITGFDVHFKVSNDPIGLGAGVKFYLERGTTAFTENIENRRAFVNSSYAASSEWPGPSRDATNRGSFEGSPSNNGLIKVSMLAMGKWWYTQTGPLILVGVAFNEDTVSQRCGFYTRESTSPPYAELTTGAGGTNSPPDTPSLDVFDVTSTGFTVNALYTDPDGDSATKYEIIWTPDA